MVDQAQVNRLNDQDAAPRHVPEHAAAFLRDVVELTELQARLLACELRDWRNRTLVTTLLFTAALIVGLSCLPAVIVGAGFLIADAIQISTGAGILLGALGGWTLAGAASALAWVRWRRQTTLLDRSRVELARNLDWIKSVLSRLGKKVASAATSDGTRSHSN